MSQPEKITVVTAWIELLMCPSIFIGKTADGWTVYCRFRWGHLSVRVDPRDPPPFYGAEGMWIFAEEIDAEGGGCMDYDELRQITGHLIDWPDQLSSRPKSDDDETLTI